MRAVEPRTLSGPAAANAERAKEIQSTAAIQGRTISDADALEQARIEHEAITTKQQSQGVALSDARLSALRNQAVLAHQRINGTTPMTLKDRLTTSRLVLGNNPDVTGEQVFQLANALPGGGGEVGTPPPAGGRPTAPTAATLPPDLATAIQQTRNYRAYSPQGRQTIQAMATMAPILTQLEDTIKAGGLENDNNALGEWFNKFLLEHHIDPGATDTARLQLAGLADAYGLRGLLVGRANLPLQQILNLHLVQAGDTPKLLLDKIQGLRAAFPQIRSAVDQAERAHIGAQGATPPAGAHPNAALPEFIGPDGKQYRNGGINPATGKIIAIPVETPAGPPPAKP